MKKCLKLIFITLLLSFAFTFLGNNCIYANDFDVDNWDPTKNESTYFTQNDKNYIAKYTNNISSTLYVVGIVVSVIAFMIVGVKYIIGSASEKAEYKKTLAPMIIGICLIVFIVSIVGFLSSLGDSING